MRILKTLFAVTIITNLLYAQTDEKMFNQQNSSLLAANVISVTVGGNFIVNGSFSALRTQRVDNFITRLFLETKEQAVSVSNELEYTSKILKKTEEYPRRNILLKHSDGTQEILDLERFRITGDFSSNPYLKNDDVIIFPPYDVDKDFVLIDGAVNKPGKVQFVEGDKLSDILFFAQGISKAYDDVTTAQISRLSYDGQTETLINVNVSEDAEVQRGDRIVFLANKPLKKDFSVKVFGEVNSPGDIYITHNNTKLIDVIERAGGLTDKAWLKKIKVIRGPQAELLKEDNILTEMKLKEYAQKLRWFEMDLGRMSNMTLEDTVTFKVDAELSYINESGNIDFSELYTDSSRANRFVMKDGDIVIIPEFKNSVYVFGQVGAAGEYDYAEGEDYDYYIKQAGGFGEFAEDEESILIKGFGKSWISFEESEGYQIEPGDYIWVPKEIQYPDSYYWDKVSKITSIVGNILGPIVTIIVILITNK